MGLTQAQLTMIEKARAVGTASLAVPLDDEACSYLVARIAYDLGVAEQIDGIPTICSVPPMRRLRCS